jgi:arginyl-tRNA synthetase
MSATGCCANDIAYHLNIFEKRGFDWAIKQWGADHAGQVPSLRLIMQKLAPGKRLDFNIHQWVRLVKDGQEMKMSKRAGTYVTVEEVIGEVGSDVTRFFFLLRSADSQMDFDLDLAREQSQKNPLFYVMYSYARANSIIRKAGERKLASVKTNYTDPTETETQLIKKLMQWPELLVQVAGDYQVQKLAHYGLEVATLFQKLYEEVNILALPEAEAAAKLYLIEQFKVFMDGYFAVLGITPQQTMTRDTETE